MLCSTLKKISLNRKEKDNVDSGNILRQIRKN